MSKLKETKLLTLAAILVAIGIILSLFKIPLSSVLEVRFTSIPISLAGALLGPGIGAIVGILIDLGGYFVKPTGPFMPLFSLSNACIALISAFFLYRKKPNLLRVSYSQCVIMLLVGLIMNSLWLSILYKLPLLPLIVSRTPKEILQFAINIAVIYFFLQKLPIYHLLGIPKEDLEA